MKGAPDTTVNYKVVPVNCTNGGDGARATETSEQLPAPAPVPDEVDEQDAEDEQDSTENPQKNIIVDPTTEYSEIAADLHEDPDPGDDPLETVQKLKLMEFESAKWEYDRTSISKNEMLYRRGYLVMFLLSIYISIISNLVSTLVPIITQPENTMSGDNLDFGNVLVREDSLIALGFSSSDYSISGIDTATDAYLVDIGSIDGTTLLSGKTYEEAFTIAKSINEMHIEEVGGCTSVDASGGLSGASSVVQYTCAPYTSTTSAELKRWITLEESECASNYHTVSALFHDCMLFNSHNPGSMYIVAGEATAVANMDCTYPTLEMYSWNVNTGLSLSSKIMNNHVLECNGDTSTQISHGFITQEYMHIYQTWPYYTEHFAFEKRCIDDLSGSLTTYNKWSGDVQLGLQQIYVYCSANGLYDGDSCWDFIFDSLDPESESWSTWKAFSESSTSNIRDFPQSLIQSAFDKDVQYSEKWLSYSEIVTNWNSSGPISSGSTFYKNTDISDYTVSYDAFRRTFGWGWDLYPNVIGGTQWDVTTKGLYSTSSKGLFPIGTQHTVEVFCFSSSASTLDSTSVGDNFRKSGVVILVPYWSKLVNAFVMVLSLSFGLLVSSSNRLVKLFARDFFTNTAGIQERRTLSETYFLIGILSVLVEGGSYLFESAIPNNLSTSCNMKMTAVLDNYWSVIIDSFVNRWTVAGLSVVLTQTLCWLQNYRGILATGTMPRNLSSLLMSVGFFYAVALSVFSIISEESCASEVNLYYFDLLFPAIVALFAVSFMSSCLKHEGHFNLVCRYEGDRYRFKSNDEDDEKSGDADGIISNEDDEKSGDADGIISNEDVAALSLAAVSQMDAKKLDILGKDAVEMVTLGSADSLPSGALASTAGAVPFAESNPCCGEACALASVSLACLASKAQRNDPDVVLFARPCPYSLENDADLHEDFKQYGVYTNGLMYRLSPLVLTFDGAISLPNFNIQRDSEWPVMENGEMVDYSEYRSFQLVQKSLSCTGVMSTIASVEINEAHEAKRSSRKIGDRKRQSLGRDQLSAEIQKFRASMPSGDRAGGEGSFEFADLADLADKNDEGCYEGEPLRWYHILRATVGVILNPIFWISLGFMLVFGSLSVLVYGAIHAVSCICFLLTSPLLLLVCGEKFVRYLRGQDRFGMLRCLYTGYSRDYEGQRDDLSRPHGYGKIYLTDDKSQIFEGMFRHGKAHGYCRLIYDRTLEYKSCLSSIWNLCPSVFFLDEENYRWSSDILGSLGVHRDYIDDIFRVHNYSHTLAERYFNFIVHIFFDYDELSTDHWTHPFRKKFEEMNHLNNGYYRGFGYNIVMWSLQKDHDQMQVEYIYEEGLPKPTIQLLYAGKKLKFDAGSPVLGERRDGYMYFNTEIQNKSTEVPVRVIKGIEDDLEEKPITPTSGRISSREIEDRHRTFFDL
jgi:hypothetical protein